jgi:Zn-dependent protease
LKWLILATVLLSWLPLLGIQVPPYHPVVQFLYRVTDPILNPLRPYSRFGTIDLSPLIAFFLIGLLQDLLRGSLSIPRLIALIITLVIAFTIHEFSHAYTAFQLGDSTARNQGRLSLDPRRHLDVLGSLMILAVGFGWAKPVPVNPNYLRNGPKMGMALVAAAGPISNLILAGLAALLVRFGLSNIGDAANFSILPAIFPSLSQLLGVFIYLNIVLFFFNLLPIAPLDGFNVLLGFLPYPASANFRRLEPLGPMILLFLLIFGRGLFTLLIDYPSNFVFNLLV